MDIEQGAVYPTPTLSFGVFWDWIVLHPNCILRAGTPETVIYDDQDLHWHFGTEGHESNETLIVQIIRGKRLMGELLVQPEQVTYVQSFEGEHEDEHVFELVSETEKQRIACYFFVLSHGFDDEITETGRVH